MKTQKKGNRRKTRKINYIKLLRTLFIIGIIIYSIIIGIKDSPKPVSTQYDGEFISYHVSKGETLWSIAEDQNYDNKDIREIVHAIRNDNNGIDGNLSIGQEIKLRTIYE